MVRDVEMLAKAVHYLVTNDVARKKMIDSGHEAIQDLRGALSVTLKSLEPYITPLTVSARLRPATVG
jgi:3-deoxy-D-manno-octulosonic-acid transferase